MFSHAAMYGPQAAFLSELFGTRVRYSGASLGAQLASVLAGGLSPLIATCAAARLRTRRARAVLIGMAVITIVAVIAASSHDSIGRDSHRDPRRSADRSTSIEIETQQSTHAMQTMKAAVLERRPAGCASRRSRFPSRSPARCSSRSAACGVCHTDLHVMKAEVAFPTPAVMGHEISGTVAALGPGVAGPAVGHAGRLARSSCRAGSAAPAAPAATTSATTSSR